MKKNIILISSVALGAIIITLAAGAIVCHINGSRHHHGPMGQDFRGRRCICRHVRHNEIHHGPDRVIIEKHDRELPRDIDMSKLNDQQKADLKECVKKELEAKKETINKMISNGSISKEQGEKMLQRMEEISKHEPGDFARRSQTN